MRIARAFAVLMMLAAPSIGRAQSANEDWRTIRSEHFRVHFAAPYEAWARSVASKLESVREAVNAEVGFAPAGITDVIIADPIAHANGSAWPFLGAPRMILWASPPSPAGPLGHESDWGELLAIHEWAHVAHLTRPSRRPLARARWFLSPVALGPVTSAPRWVSEGYATVLEGKLSGQGRPFSDYRAVILRTWAQRGRLPTYQQLGSDGTSWMGMSMAYLAGSAYLEWLVERHGEQSLGRLWARMTAREERTFDQAFEGVFGDSPKRLYQRFAAEITHRAILVEGAVAESQQAGELWMDLSWTTGEPDISADGQRIVTISRGRRKPSRLVVYSTEPDKQAEADRAGRIDRMLARDPEDHAPVSDKPLPRKPVAEHVFRPGEIVGTPRWVGSTDDVLFVAFRPDREGFLHPDLYRWGPVSGTAPRRLTFGADLRDPRPSADGKSALAVRNRFGLSELVRIDLHGGTITTIEGPSLDEQFADPAPHPYFPRFAMVARRDGKWRLEVRDLADGAGDAAIAFDGVVAQPAWSRDGKALFATVGRDGFVEIERFDYNAASGALVPRGQITRGAGASFAAVAADDAIWFLALDPDGLDLRKLTLDSAEKALPTIAVPPGTEPVVRRSAAFPDKLITPIATGASTPYGMGRQEVSPLLGGGYAPSGSVLEGGVRIGDVLGRLETIALAAAGSDGGVEGGSISIDTNLYPFGLGARLFALDESPTEQRKNDVSSSRDLDRMGLELWTSRSLHWSGGRLQGRAAAYADDIDVRGAGGFTQVGVGLTVRAEHAALVGSGLLVPMSARVVGNTGSTDGESWARGRTALTIGIASRGFGVSVEVDAGSAGRSAPWFEQFEIGGAKSSLLPEAAMANRVEVRALPAGVLRGRSFDAVRTEISFGGVLPTLFWQRLRADVDSGDDTVNLAGIEWALNVDAMPIARLPALEFRAGAAHVLDSGILEDETSFWMTICWKP